MSVLKTIADWLGAERYSQHSVCLTNDPLIMTAFVASDLVTFLSYFTIGMTLIVYRNRIVEFTGPTRLLYGAFIFLCGLSHLTETLTMFVGIYRLDVAVTAAMAGVSAATAIVTASEMSGAPRTAG